MNDAPHILLVDDDALIRRMAGDLLRQELPHARIDEVDSLSGLQQALEAGGFNLAITDYQLGWTDGLTVLREVKRRYPDCPVVMFTGTGSEEIAVEAMKAGLEDYVLKSPHHIGRLTAAVHSVLAQAEQRRQLKESEARQRSLLHDVLGTSAVGLFILDAEFRVVWVNEAMERCFGLRRADVIGRDKRRLIQERFKALFDQPDEFAARILQSYERNNGELCFECHMPGADGREERWLEHRSLPIRTGLYAGGRIEHYYDITERKRAEAAARQNEASLAALVSSAMDAIVVVDHAHRILLFNGAAETMFGCAAAEAIGQPLDRFVPERFRGVHREHIKRYGETGQTNRVMGRLGTVYGLRSDGTEFPLEVSLSKGTAGERTFYTAILRDITERQRTEGLLRQTNETLSALIDASPLAIAMLDVEGNAQVWNPAAERIFGWSAGEVLGRPLPIVPEEKRDEHRAIRERVLRDKAFTGLEVVRRRKDSSPITISLSTAPLRNTEGRITGIMGIMADVTERKQMERHAGRIERLAALGQLLSGVAHEIKNPLFVLTGRLQLLKEKLAAQDYGDMPADLKTIEEAAKRMTRVT
ncbi:MAG: PAS domain S-box protein, partial [Nitrospirota bacterium]|nr:PAS domain S-box protein [Nitrospirota bacterium]